MAAVTIIAVIRIFLLTIIIAYPQHIDAIMLTSGSITLINNNPINAVTANKTVGSIVSVTCFSVSSAVSHCLLDNAFSPCVNLPEDSAVNKSLLFKDV